MVWGVWCGVWGFGVFFFLVWRFFGVGGFWCVFFLCGAVFGVGRFGVGGRSFGVCVGRGGGEERGVLVCG